MDERRVEKRTEIEETTDVEHKRVRPGTTNVNVGPNGETQVQESGDIVDDPVGTTTVRKDTTTIEERREP
jgi:hypothetical protein